MENLIEIERYIDTRLKQRFSTRVYKDHYGNIWRLSRNIDSNPKYFECYGPYKTEIVLPMFEMEFDISLEYFWGHGFSWKKSEMIFDKAVFTFHHENNQIALARNSDDKSVQNIFTIFIFVLKSMYGDENEIEKLNDAELIRLAKSSSSDIVRTTLNTLITFDFS